MDPLSEVQKRKQHHSEALSQNVTDIQDQAQKMSTRPSEQSRANQQAEQLATSRMQTQVAQAQNNDNLEMQHLCNRYQQHLEHEQNLEAAFDAAKNLIDKLKAQIQEKDARITQMQVDNTNFATERRCDARRIAWIRDIINRKLRLQDRFRRVKADSQVLKGNIEELNEEIKQERAEKYEMAEVIKSTANDKRALQAHVQILDNEKIQMAEQVVDIRNANTTLKRKTSILEEQIQQLNSDKRNLIGIINSDEHTAVEEERQRMRVEKENLVTIVETLNANAADLRSENTTLHTRNTALEADNAKLRAKIDDISVIATIRTELLVAQREQINTLTKVAENLEHEQNELLQQIDTLNDENRQLKAENQAVNEQSHHEQDRLDQQIEQLKYENLQLEEQNDTLHKQVIDLSKESKEFDKAHDNAHAHIEFHHERGGLHQQIDQLKHEKLQLEEDNDALHKKVADLSRQVEEFDEAQDAAHAHIEELQLQARVHKTSRELQLLEARKQQQGPQHPLGTQTTTQKTASTQTSAQMTIVDAFKHIEFSKQDLTQEIQRNAASEQQLRNTIYALESDKSDLQGQVQRMKVEATSTKTRLAASEREWRAEIAELKQVNNSKEIEKLMDEKMEVYMEWRAEVKELKEKVQDGLDSNNMLREQIGMFEDQIQDMVAERFGSVLPETVYAAWADMVSKQDTPAGQEDENDNASEADTDNTLIGDSPNQGEEVLAKGPNARKRGREEEVVEKRVEGVERASRLQNKRIKVE